MSPFSNIILVDDGLGQEGATINHFCGYPLRHRERIYYTRSSFLVELCYTPTNLFKNWDPSHSPIYLLIENFGINFQIHNL